MLDRQVAQSVDHGVRSAIQVQQSHRHSPKPDGIQHLMAQLREHGNALCQGALQGARGISELLDMVDERLHDAHEQLVSDVYEGCTLATMPNPLREIRRLGHEPGARALQDDEVYLRND